SEIADHGAVALKRDGGGAAQQHAYLVAAFGERTHEALPDESGRPGQRNGGHGRNLADPADKERPAVRRPPRVSWHGDASLSRWSMRLLRLRRANGNRLRL